MGHTNDRSTKASSLVNPTSLNLQPRPFAPLESDEKEEAVSRKSGYSENFLEKIINTPRSESATPIQRKPENRLKAIATERTNIAIQNQSIQRQEAVEEEKSEGGQEAAKEFTMNPEPPPVQRKFENRLRAKNAQKMAIQAKLAIGEPNDKYEQEADATAAMVVQQINSPMTSQSQPVQRKFENRLRAKNAQEMAIQPKIAISELTPSLAQSVQRQGMEEEEELQMKPIVQRRENLGGGEASTDLESAIQSARGSGQSLDANLQESMGQAMGADFSGVKVHTDSQSDQLNKSIQAKAFTTGQDLFFRQGAYEPSSRGGQELIAHELTHVVQQNGGAVQMRSMPPKQEKPQNFLARTKLSVNIPQGKNEIQRFMDKEGKEITKELVESASIEQLELWEGLDHDWDDEAYELLEDRLKEHKEKNVVTTSVTTPETTPVREEQPLPTPRELFSASLGSNLPKRNLMTIYDQNAELAVKVRDAYNSEANPCINEDLMLELAQAGLLWKDRFKYRESVGGQNGMIYTFWLSVSGGEPIGEWHVHWEAKKKAGTPGWKKGRTGVKIGGDDIVMMKKFLGDWWAIVVNSGGSRVKVG